MLTGHGYRTLLRDEAAKIMVQSIIVVPSYINIDQPPYAATEPVLHPVPAGKEIQQRDTQRQTAKLQGPTFTHASPESWLSILLMRGTARWHSFRSDGCISVAEPTCWQALKDFGEKNNHKDEFKSGYVTSFEEHKDVLALDQEFWLGFSSRRPLKRAPVFVCLT